MIVLNSRRTWTKALSRILLSGAMVASATVPAIPSQADLDLIQSYIGDWRGTGVLKQPGQPDETVRCRLEIDRTNAESVNFHGRCSVAGAQLQMDGTLAYVSANNRYEAQMRSSLEFQGVAIGRRNGQNVDFAFQAINDSGEKADIDADFGLVNDEIRVDFVIVSQAGNKFSASVPFNRQ